MDPVTAAAAAIAIIQAISALNSGPDGLGANFVAINGKLDLAIRMLGDIERSLEYIIKSIAALKEELIKALGEEHAYELYNKVGARIEAIQDKIREAKIKGINIGSDKRKGGYFDQFSQEYVSFDEARRDLRKWPQGCGPISSSICTACLAVDCAAFAYGVITDTALTITLQRHILWLDNMLNPDQQYSIAAALNSDATKEAEIVELASKGSQTPSDYVSDLVYNLYKASPIELCVVYRMDAFFISDITRDWVSAGVTRSVLVATFTREEIDFYGAKFLKNIVDRDHSVAHFKPDGVLWRPWPAMPKAENPRSDCFSVDLPTWSIPYDLLAQLGALNHHDDSTIWKDIAAAVFDHVRNTGPQWVGWTSSATWKAAQLVFDKINLCRIRQVYEKNCIDLVTQHRKDAIALLKEFPDIGHMVEE